MCASLPEVHGRGPKEVSEGAATHIAALVQEELKNDISSKSLRKGENCIQGVDASVEGLSKAHYVSPIDRRQQLSSNISPEAEIYRARMIGTFLGELENFLSTGFQAKRFSTMFEETLNSCGD